MHAKTQKKQDTVANNRKKKETNRAFARAGRAEGEREGREWHIWKETRVVITRSEVTKNQMKRYVALFKNES